jgi:hypothetical protein
MLMRRNGRGDWYNFSRIRHMFGGGWKVVAMMWWGQRVWWRRESGDNHIGGDDMGDRWREVRGRGRKGDVT